MTTEELLIAVSFLANRDGADLAVFVGLQCPGALKESPKVGNWVAFAAHTRTGSAGTKVEPTGPIGHGTNSGQALRDYAQRVVADCERRVQVLDGQLAEYRQKLKQALDLMP